MSQEQSEYRSSAPTLGEGQNILPQVDVNGNQKTTQATLSAGEDLTNDVQKVEQRFSYSVVTADKQVKAGAGFLHTITITGTDAAAVAGTITFYDKLTEAAPALFSIYIPAAQVVPVTLTLDVNFATGLYVGFDASVTEVSLTVSYR
jgi:hypothetical protein